MKKSAIHSMKKYSPNTVGLGIGLMTGTQEVTLSNQDSVLTVMADPDLSTAREAYGDAKSRALGLVNSLDFSSDQAATSSLSSVMAIIDGARRVADLSLTRQYQHELAQLDHRTASHQGEMEKLTQELKLLEDELRMLEAKEISTVA